MHSAQYKLNRLFILLPVLLTAFLALAGTAFAGGGNWGG
jgi:hypothetical protein